MTDKTLEQRAIELKEIAKEKANEYWIEKNHGVWVRQDDGCDFIQQWAAIQGFTNGYIKGAADQESRHLLTVEQEKEAIELIKRWKELAESDGFHFKESWDLMKARNEFLSTITKQENNETSI